MSNLDDCMDEGLAYSLREQWLTPDEIEDVFLRSKVEDALEYLWAFQAAVDEASSYYYEHVCLRRTSDG